MSEQNDTSLMADVIGTKIDFSPDGAVSEDGWKKLSVAVQPYSDKRYETARYFFVNKDGQVVRHVAVSARQPSATNIKPSEKFLLALRTYASQNDCRIVFMHNHPSGYVRPSEADISLTEKLESYFVDIEGARRFLGHIISGYGSFGIYEPYKDGGWKSLVDGRFGDISRIDETFEFQEGEFNLRVRTDSDLIDLKMKADELDSVGAWDKERWVPCCFATQNGIVRKFDHISVLDFSNPLALAETLKSTGRENNSDLVYLLPNSRKQFLMCEGFAQKTRMVEDNFYINSDDTMEHSSYGGGRIFGMTRLDEILVQDTDELLSREERDRIIRNKKFKGDNFMETNIKENVEDDESKKLNFVLEKFEAAGIEVVQDKAEFDRILESHNILQKMETTTEEKNLSEPEQEPVEEKKGKTLTVEERQALKDGALIRDFFDNMKDGYKTMQSEEHKDLFPDFLSMFRDRTSFYTDEQKAAISKKIQELSGTASQEDAFKYLEKRVATDVAIEQGAAWEYNDRNEKVLKEDKSYTQEEKESAIKFSRETSENQPLPDSEDELINLLKQQIEEQKKINAALSQQNEMLFGKVNALTQEMSQMREQLELYKGQVSQTHGGEAREQGRGDEGYNQPAHQETEITRPGAFTNKVAWTPNQEIPKFGQLIDGEIKICEGYVFGKFVENEKSPAENTVEVENPNLPENAPLRKIVLSERAYRNIIAANEELERKKQNSQGIENSWEWYKAHEEYREKLSLDQHILRSNIPENFMHNFRVACERAENYDEAMQMAKILVDNLTPYGRKRFNHQRKLYGAKEFDEQLRKAYDEASQNKEYKETNPFKKYIDPASKLFAKDAEENPGLYELPKDEKIPGTSMKIGETVKMSMSFKSFSGKVRKTPVTDWQIMKVSQNITPPRAVVYSDKAKCTYTVPLEPLVKHIRKVEKTVQREELKKQKADFKKYGTKKQIQDFPERS